MHYLLAYVTCKATKTGVSFTWDGAWEFDQMSGSGRVTLRRDGRLKGTFSVNDHRDPRESGRSTTKLFTFTSSS
jgi:metal-sulfur cluster biosynthetic enzyme